MTIRYPLMGAVDIGVGESCARNPNGGPAAGGSYCIVGSFASKAQGCALLPEVPPNTGEEFN